MLCYVMLCYAMLCYAMLCYVILYYIILCKILQIEKIKIFRAFWLEGGYKMPPAGCFSIFSAMEKDTRTKIGEFS